MNKIPTENLDAMRAKLSALEPHRPSELTAREVVRELEVEIRAAIERGVTIYEMIAALKPHAFEISPSTLASYLRELSSESKQRPRRKAKKEVSQPIPKVAQAPDATECAEKATLGDGVEKFETVTTPDVSSVAAPSTIVFRNLTDV